MVDPEREPLPTPVVMGKMQRDAVAREVDLTVRQWVDALSRQRASESEIGTLWLCTSKMTDVQMTAVQIFREQGWAVLIKRHPSLFFTSTIGLHFRPAIFYNVNVPMPAGVVPPPPDCHREPYPALAEDDRAATEPSSDFVVPPGPAEILIVQGGDFETAVQETVNTWLKQLQRQTCKEYSWGTIDGLNSPLSAIEEEALKRFENAGWAISRQRYLVARYLFLPSTRLKFGSKPHPADPSNPVCR